MVAPSPSTTPIATIPSVSANPWHRRFPEAYKNNIITGDSRMWAEDIPDRSVDLILCDPVWWFMDQYAWLAQFAVRALKPTGAVVAQAGSGLSWQAEATMRAAGGANLCPHPVVVEVFTGGNRLMFDKRLVSGYLPYLVFTRQPRLREGDWLHTCIRGGGREKGLHEWGDSPNAYFHFVERLTPVGGVVVDPFTGSGTVPAVCKMLRRNYAACEIDPDRAATARTRLETVQEMHPAMVALELQTALDFSDDELGA